MELITLQPGDDVGCSYCSEDADFVIDETDYCCRKHLLKCIDDNLVGYELSPKMQEWLTKEMEKLGWTRKGSRLKNGTKRKAKRS